MMNNLLRGAQVAKNLLNVLQGYTKGIRFLLVMFLTLTVSANAWADYTITFNTGTGSEVTTKDAIIYDGVDYVSSVSASKTYAESDGLRYGSSSAMGYTTFTLSDKGQIKASKIIFQGAKYYSSDNSSLQYTITYTDATTTSGTIALTNTKTDKEATLESSKTISEIDIRKIASSKKRFYVQGVTVVAASAAPSYTVTATSNNNTYGTVSVSGTTITASPKTGYTYANPAYTVTAGTASVAQSGNTFTVTPSTNCTIRINFTEKVKNTYVDNVQGYSIQTLYDTHAAPSLTDKAQATTGTCEQQHWHFMGWVTEANKENPTDDNIVKAGASVTANGTTYYAVWATGTTTEEESKSKQYSFDIIPSNFNSTSYAANNNEKTSTAKASDGSTLSVKWTSNQVMLQSSDMQWQKSAGYIYNSTDLGTINSVTVTSTAGTFTTYYGTSEKPSSSTTAGNGYFQIKVGSATGKTSKVTITFTKTILGAQTTTYSDYITSCVTETVVTLHPNGGDGEEISETTEGTTYTVPACSFSRLGYTFANWNTKENGTGISYNTGATINNLDGTDVNLYAQWTCETPVFDIKIKDDNPVVFSGEPIELTVVGSNIAAGATYQWYKKNGESYDELTGQKANKLTIDEATANDAGNYKCVVTNGTCSGENNYTVKMYHIKGLTDAAWEESFEFVKSGDKEGTFTIELAATTTYYFKLNDGSVWYWNEGTMTHNNCTDWVIEQEGADTQGKANTGITTTASGIYTFTLNYADPAKPKLSVTYPQKKMVYFNPNMWDADGDTEVYTVYSWQEGSNGSFVTMTSVEGCGNTNIYQAEIDASHNKLLFIRWNQAHTAWDNNRWNQSTDLDYQTNGQYKIDDWGNNSDLYWKDGAKKSWASYEKTFTPNYTVTFDANGHGTAPDAQCVAKNGKATTPAAPTATGYTFGGWYKEAGCTNVWDFANDVVTADITLYAKWTANTNTAYRVLHYQQNILDDNYTLYETENFTGTTAATVTPAVKDYTGFKAPTTQTVTIAADGNTVVEYKYTRNSYTLTWNLAGGFQIKAGTSAGLVKYGAPLTAPTVTKSNLTFIGWSPVLPDTMPAENVTYTAIWENCIWVETEIGDIEDEDVVVVTMTNGVTTWALDKTLSGQNYPLATTVEIRGNEIVGDVDPVLQWNIVTNDSEYTIYPNNSVDMWLYCTKSGNVKIGKDVNKSFTIENGYFKRTNTTDLWEGYLAIATSAATPDWRMYQVTQNVIKNKEQTLKFYKRVCLPEGQYWVKWMVNGQEYTEGNPTTKVVAGGQVVTLPTIPDDYQLPGCTSKKFIGWTTDEILVETDDAPTMFTDAASSPAINTNQTFHALFADVEGGETTYEKVTTISEGTYLMATTTADQYITKSTLAYTGKTVDNDNRGGVTAVTITNGVIGVKPELAKEITVTLGTEDDANYFAMFDGEYYITQTAKNKFTFASEVSYEWRLNANGQIKQKSVYDGKDDIRIYMNNGNSGSRTEYFCPYAAKSEGNNNSTYYYHAYLFKKIGGMSYSNYVTQCCTPWEAPTLSATTSIAVGGSTTITHSGTTHGAVTYTPSNTDIATVDANGKVTGVKPGKVTITATWDGVDGVNNYCPAEATIDIAVTGSFTITYNANHASATGTTASTIIAYPDGTGTVANNGFDLDGHEFVKWNTATDGSGYDYTEGASITLTDNLTLYAIWQPNQYDITVNVVGGSITLGTTTITTANTPQTITDVVAHGQSFSFTNATPDAAYETPYTVTLVSGTATVTSNSLTISNVQSDLEITIEYTLKPVYTITYNIPEDGGELAADAVTSIYKGGFITLPNVSNPPLFDCEEFIGWTTHSNREYESTEGQMPDPFYAAGSSLAINNDIQLYAVYSRAGNGPSGTVELTCTDVATWKSDVLSGNNNSYGTVTTRTATDGSAWTTDGMIQNAGGISLSGNHYIQIPTLPGPITNIIMKVSQGNLGNDDACYEYIANTTSRAFHFRSAADGSNLFTSKTVAEASRSRTIEITEGNYTTGYIINGEGTSHVHAITVAYGSPNIISTSLNCSNDIDEFTITYNTNYGSAIGQIPTGTVVNGACDNSGEPIRFEDLPNGEYTICNSLTATQYKLVGWNSQANGNGGLSYEPGDVITMVPQSDITLYAQWVPEVIMLDNQDRTITYQETVGEAITLPAGAYTCDGKYTFVGWTTDNVDSWNQKITKPTLVAELDGNDETLFVPTEPTVVYAVYKLETTANSKAFYLKSDNNFYAQKHNAYVLDGTSNIANATRLYRQQINVESPNNYWLYYLDDEQQKRFVYINTADLGELFAPSIGDGETTPEDTEGWEFVSVTGGYKLKALGTYGNNVGIVTHYMHTNESGNMGSNKTGSVYTIETATEINYYAYPTCSDEITITFETRGGTLIPNDHPYVLTKKEGDVITLPGCEYAGLDFIGWVDEPIEPTEIIANPEDIYEAEEEYVVGDQNIVLYAYYSQTPESAEYDGNSDGEWKIYAFANGEYHFAVAPNSEEGDMSTVTICDKSTTWTFTNVAENQYYIQDEAGRYVGVRPAIENKNDFRFTDEPVIWTIESKGDDLYRLTCETNTDRVMLYDNGRIRHSSHTQEEKPGYFYVTIGGCFNPIYTTDPARLQAVSVYGTVQITSTLGQTVKAMDKLTLVVRHAEPESYIRFSSPNVTFYDESGNVITTAPVESQKQQIPLVVAYTPDVADNSIARPAITVTANTLNPSTGTYVETNYSVNGRISARSLPADFAIVAKVGNLWYALPSQGLNSTDALIGYPVEVDNQNDPTVVTAVPENADWSLRQVYAASHSDAQKDRFKQYGANIMFENNASPAKMLNASVSDNYLLTYAEYDNYKKSDNQGLYEWTPTTTDLETYTLTNAGRTDKKLNISVNTVFGVHTQNVATNSLRFLPIQNSYTPAALQVVEWKENSVVIMYNGDPAQTAFVSVNGGEAQETVLSSAQRDIAVYELTADGLVANPTQRLSITIGTEKMLLPIPYIVNSNTTDATLTGNNKTLAAVSDLVVLNGKTLTADAATASKYTFRNVTIYGGGKLVIPSDKGFGVASFTLRAGGITDAGEYDYVYPQFELRGTFTNSAAKINYDYITDYDHWYHLVLPFAGDLTTIKYPTEFYGANVAANNRGSWQIKRYAGEIRATGNYNAWVDIETEDKTSTTAGQGYIFWGAPKKVSVNGGASTRQKWGIQRITMSVTAPNAMTAENGDKAISELSSYANVPNNSKKDNDQGWNLIGNPYMVNLTDMATTGLHACKLVEVIDPATGKWNGKWEWNDETDIRYLTIPSDHFDFYTAKTVAKSVPLVPGRAFFVQLDGEANGITFAAANRASLMPALRAANDKPVDIETGIVLSNETLQDEVNFWIKAGKTNDYEYNADYPKTPNNNHFNIYGVHTNGDLSWVATGPEYAAESMPIGYQVPAAGTYMLSLSEIYNSDDLEALYITDHALSPEVTVDIMSEPYEFSVNQAETNDKRFTVSIKLKKDSENDATGLDNININGEEIQKFIYQDKMYILHHGIIYDATGKRVITINK